MPFTVRDFPSLIRALERAPEWKAELRRLLLTEELLHLPELVREIARHVAELGAAQLRTQEHLARLGEAQIRTEERLARLGEAQIRTEERLARLEEAQLRTQEHLARLGEAQIRTEERLARLEEAQIRTEERLARLEEAVEELVRTQTRMARQLEAMQRTQDRFAQVVGATAEARMRPVVRAWLESRGLRILDPILAWSLNGLTELDGVTRAQGPGGVVWVLVSAKARVTPGDVSDLASTLRRPEVQGRLQAEGICGETWPVVFGLTAERRVLEEARQRGVGLLIEGEGEVVPPQPLVL